MQTNLKALLAAFLGLVPLPSLTLGEGVFLER